MGVVVAAGVVIQDYLDGIYMGVGLNGFGTFYFFWGFTPLKIYTSEDLKWDTPFGRISNQPCIVLQGYFIDTATKPYKIDLKIVRVNYGI
jgi:hypothetical protein